MKRKMNKKGFTIVELVIVIAVIAILAAVLIPTFVSLTRKANIAADTAVANNLNKALAVYSATEGNPDDIDEVVDALEAAGYIVSALNAKTEGHYFVWESESNQIILVDEEFKLVSDVKIKNDTIGDTWYFPVADAELKAAVEAAGGKTYWAPVSAAGLVDALKDLFNSTNAVNETIYAMDDIELNTTEQFVLNTAGSDVVLDLGGNTVSGNTETVPFSVKQGTFTIANGTITSSGVVTAANGTKVETAFEAYAGTNVKLENVEMSANVNYAALDMMGATANINGLVVKNAKMGMEVSCGANVVIDNADITVLQQAIQVVGNYKSSEATVSKLTINGGRFTSTNEISTPIKVHTQGAGTAEIVINGGEFNSECGKIFAFNGSMKTTITITGGTFNGVDFADVDWDALCRAGEGNPTWNVTMTNGTVVITVNP